MGGPWHRQILRRHAAESTLASLASLATKSVQPLVCLYFGVPKCILVHEAFVCQDSPIKGYPLQPSERINRTSNTGGMCTVILKRTSGQLSVCSPKSIKMFYKELHIIYLIFKRNIFYWSREAVGIFMEQLSQNPGVSNNTVDWGAILLDRKSRKTINLIKRYVFCRYS